jgi:UDP-N-acetylmuramate dehydrogenase
MNEIAPLTTLNVGGPAQQILHVRSEDELIDAVKSAGDNLLILGGGSNVLVSDSGFPGTVVVVETMGNSYEIDACSGGTLTVAAGEDWDEFVAFTIEKGLANLECLSGIPGKVGASPIQNIGAYGHEVSEVIARVRTFDRHEKRVRTFSASECGFGYRTSLFKEQSPRYVVLDVTFQLRRGEQSLPILYQDLATELNVTVGSRVEIATVRDAVLSIRRRKGMLLDSGLRSAGSFFKNPIVEPSLLPHDAPQWAVEGSDKVKTSAAWLMEKAGVEKGEQRGGAAISPLHVLALTNHQSASAEDLIELAKSAQQRVRAKFGIDLEPEVQLIGVSI